MEEIKEGEIVYATLSVKDKKEKIHELRKVVFSRNWKCNYPLLDQELYTRFLKQNNIKTSAEVTSVEIHARTGFKHKSKGFTTAKRNEQIRDSITGAYV